MTLELSNGKRIRDPNDSQLEAALQELNGEENNTLTLHKGVSSSLRVERDVRPRYYFYFRQVASLQQAAQPVSQHIAKKILLEYAQGKRSWKKAIRLEKIEVEDSGRVYDPEEVKEYSDEELQAQSGRTTTSLWILLGFGILTLGLVALFIGSMDEVSPEIALRLGSIVFVLIAVVIFVFRRQWDLKKEADRRKKGA